MEGRVFLHEQKNCFLQTTIHTHKQTYITHSKMVVLEGVDNTAVASLDDDLTMAWKEDVVRGSLFWLAHPLRNFSAQQQPLFRVKVRLGKHYQFTYGQFNGRMQQCLHSFIIPEYNCIKHIA